MVSTQESKGQLLFILSEDPSRSFYYPYDNFQASFTSLEEILKDVMKKMKKVFLFCDAFGRPLTTFFGKSLEEVKCLQPFYAKILVGGYRLFCKTSTGAEIQLYSCPSDSIEDLKLQIYTQTNLPCNEQMLIFGNKKLKDGRTLAHYNIQSGSRLVVKPIMMVGMCRGMNFADITDTSKAQPLTWSETAPEWRYVSDNGLCLEGKCMNKTCKAYNNWVIINKGIGTYDLVYDQHNNLCPICKSYVKTEKCAFNNCLYSYAGVMYQEDGTPPKKVLSQEFIKVEDIYMLFDPEFCGTATWLSLKIITKEIDSKSMEELTCGICRKPLKSDKKIQKECKHSYHYECLQKTKSLNSNCVLCHL